MLLSVWDYEFDKRYISTAEDRLATGVFSRSIMPNTHRRRRRDSTVELSRVGFGGVGNSQLVHDDCRRIRSTIWKLNIAV